MKKLLLILILVLLLGTEAFADHEGFGIGVVGGGGMVFNPFGFWGLSLKIPAIPIFWAFSFPYFGSRGFAFGLSGDYYFIDKNLVSNDVTNEDGTYKFKLDWFLGLGGYVNASFGDYRGKWNNGRGRWDYERKGEVDFGLRVPIGLSWHIIKQLELFAALIPGVGFRIWPEWDTHHDEFSTEFRTHFAGSAEIGVRYWFN